MTRCNSTPPKHLRADTAAWFTSVIREYELEEHHTRLLVKACEAHGIEANKPAKRSPNTA